jgi:hypothetical protein
MNRLIKGRTYVSFKYGPMLLVGMTETGYRFLVRSKDGDYEEDYEIWLPASACENFKEYDPDCGYETTG